ncbi:MAG TPA: ABC transporter permease [Pyrinomonadaceae bacterium]|nr:ABC transporter permease [Pyrinomonadaceae bacterium]
MHSHKLRKILIGSVPFLVVGLVWYVLANSGWIDPTFLPSMSSVGRAIVLGFTEESYLADVWVSVYRVLAAFFISAVIAIPIGLLAGHKKRIADLMEPFVGFVRYLPVPAFVPLCILWFGLADTAKIAVIFLGTFFQLIILVSDVGRRIERDYFLAAQTLGANRRQMLFRVLWPASLPGVVSACRTAVGWAWTYLVVAEIAGATAGIGFRIMQAQRYVETPKVFAGIVVIGLLGMTTDLLFQVIHKVSFRWL